MFSAALREDFRFPFTEILVFIYAFFILFLTAFIPVTSSGTPGQAVIQYLTYALASVFSPMLIFLILMMKNVSFGLGRDLDRGIMQTFLSYPITRRKILTARLLSAIVPYLAIFVGLQLLALLIFAPSFLSSQLALFGLAYISALALPLWLTGVMAVVTLLLRRGGFLPIILGIVFFYVQGFIQTLSFLFGPTATQFMALFNPFIALQSYYTYSQGSPSGFRFPSNAVWAPSLETVYLTIIGGYAIVILIYAAAYYIFDRRLGL